MKEQLEGENVQRHTDEGELYSSFLWEPPSLSPGEQIKIRQEHNMLVNDSIPNHKGLVQE